MIALSSALGSIGELAGGRSRRKDCLRQVAKVRGVFDETMSDPPADLPPWLTNETIDKSGPIIGSRLTGLLHSAAYPALRPPPRGDG
jgi:hypothetical protein